MTQVFLLVSLLLGAGTPEIVRTVPNGPILIPSLQVVVTPTGGLLDAKEATLGRDLAFSVWFTARGSLVVLPDGDRPRVRAWGAFVPREGSPGLDYLSAGLGNLLGGPQSAGAVFRLRDPKAPYRAIDPSGRIDSFAELPAKDALLGLFGLGGEGPDPPWALAQGRFGDRPLGAVDATGRLGGAAGDGGAASLSRLLRAGAEGETPTAVEGPEALLLHLTAGRALGVRRVEPSGLFGPCLLDLADGVDLCSGRAWLREAPEMGRPARAVRRADGDWLEFAGMAVDLTNGDSRICWNDPAAWAVSPDRTLSAVLDGYRPANPAAWADPATRPRAQEVWLAVVPAGGESESPLRRPETRWAACVTREALAAWPPTDLLPVWSPDGKRLACAARVYAVEEGAVLGTLEEGAVPLAFTGEGTLVYLAHEGADRRPVLRVWDESEPLPEDLDLHKAIPLAG